MQFYWLNRKNNEKLIIFFCGWSFDYKPFERLDCCDNDVLAVYDYGKMDFPEISLAEYKQTTLIAWSMGVYAAYLCRNSLPKFDKKIAINGTPFPVHDELGIPEKTFALTLKFVETGLQGKFQKNLFKKPEDFEKYQLCPVERTIENRINELVELDKYISQAEYEYSRFYDCAIISDTDKIIPTRNQIKCWEHKARCLILDSGHCPFYDFNSWNEIIDLCK